MRQGPSHVWGATLVLVAAGVLAGCSSDPEATSTPSPEPSSTAPTSEAPADDAVRYVAFGDSWPEGAHCGGCESFAFLWADLIEKETGRTVELTNFMGSAEESNADGKTSASLLASLGEEATQQAVAAADVILIATGPNALNDVVPKVLSGKCGRSDDFDCIRDTGAAWAKDFEAILNEIDRIREDRPALVRLVNAGNLFAMDPALAKAVPKGFVSTGGELMFELLTQAQCDAAKAHRAVCVDVRPLITGPGGDGDENSHASMRAVADALIKTGLRDLPDTGRG